LIRLTLSDIVVISLPSYKDSPVSKRIKKIKIKGKESWDDSDRMEFLEQYVQNNIIPMLKPSLQDNIEGEEVPF